MLVMDENNIKEISVNNFIALCHILDDYDPFMSDLTQFISRNCNRDDVYKLVAISHDDYVVGITEAKRFYKAYKKIIDIINTYSNIDDFIYYIFDSKGKIRSDSNIDFFRKYLLMHDTKIDKTLSLLQKISQLGFEMLTFDRTLNFTEDVYTVNTTFEQNSDIVYMDNLELSSNLEDDIVEYKTSGSNYKITIGVIFSQLSKSDRKIIVNSLVFDADRLPNDITKDSIFNKIINLKGNKQDNTVTQNIKHQNINVDELYKQFGFTRDDAENSEDKGQPVKQKKLEKGYNANTDIN